MIFMKQYCAYYENGLCKNNIFVYILNEKVNYICIYSENVVKCPLYKKKKRRKHLKGYSWKKLIYKILKKRRRRKNKLSYL